MASMQTPKHAGEPNGIVTDIQQSSFRLNVSPSLNNGDGLTFFHQNGELMGTLVNRVDGNTVTPSQMGGIQIGTQIRRNADRVFLKQVETSNNERRIPIRIHFSDTATGFHLLVHDRDGNWVRITLEEEKIPARKTDGVKPAIHRQFSRLGNTEFSLENLEIIFSKPYFLPVSTLNHIRREMVTQLQAERKKNFHRWQVVLHPTQTPFPLKNLTYFGNVLNKKAEAFYRHHGVRVIEPAAESGLDMQGKKVMTTKHCLKYEFDGCPHLVDPVQLDEPLFLVNENGLRLRLKFDCRACLMEVYFEKGSHKKMQT